MIFRHLRQAGVHRMTIANRTYARARSLAERFGAEAILLSDVSAALPQADILIASTAADLPILGKGMVESALKARRRRPMFMVDIAVPRDIEPQVGELDDVFLYTVDDLADIIAENRRAREHAAQDAEQIIEQGVSAYLRDVRARAASETVRAYRSLAEAQAEEELERALKRLRAGEAPEAVLQRFSRSLTNKLTHLPTARLREASAAGRHEVVAHGRRLLGLDAGYHDE